MSQINWEQFYATNDLEIKNSIFEEEVLKILDKKAPLKKCQNKKNLRKWVSSEVKKLIEDRDKQKEKARTSRKNH